MHDTWNNLTLSNLSVAFYFSSRLNKVIMKSRRTLKKIDMHFPSFIGEPYQRRVHSNLAVFVLGQSRHFFRFNVRFFTLSTEGQTVLA